MIKNIIISFTVWHNNLLYVLLLSERPDGHFSFFMRWESEINKN